MSQELGQFYFTCSIADEITEITWKMRDSQAKLIGKVKIFMLAKWHEILKKRKIMQEIRLDCVGILGNLEEYSVLMQDLSKNRNNMREDMAHNELFEKLINKVLEREKYHEPETIEIDSLMRLIDHVREEIGTYGTNFSTIVSALVGAIIGSVLTIVISYVLGVPR